MARPGIPEGARFFVAILAAGQRELNDACEALTEEYGPGERASVALPFTNTEYYRDELGAAPIRAFMAFPGQFATDALAARKIASNRLEDVLAHRLGGPSPRPVNLDPGYLTQAKLVLASAKNFAHRIHLRDGIYAEVTLLYKRGQFHSLPWTFPDYASGAYHPFFLELRDTIPSRVAPQQRRDPE